MPDDIDDSTDTSDPTEPATGDVDAEVAKWKSLARQHEARAKANADKAKRLDEIEEASKSEVEKAKDAAAAAERRAAEAESRAMRLEVAQAKGLTAGQAKRLVGTTREELEADADELLADFTPPDTGDSGGKPSPPRQPRQNLKPGGGDPTDEPVETDPAKLAAAVPRGF